MAKADYIRCDACDCKLVYDADDKIFEALDELGLANLPTYCGECADKAALMYSCYRGGEEWVQVRPSNRKTET